MPRMEVGLRGKEEMIVEPFRFGKCDGEYRS